MQNICSAACSQKSAQCNKALPAFTYHVQVEYHLQRAENTMGKVMFGLSVSLDGFIADKNDDVSFDHLGSKPIQLERIRTLETPGATHLSFHAVK
jgi:hypothetical protein